MPSFLVLLLGLLFVSFHPSRLRSHSRSIGASLFPFPFVHFILGLPARLPLSFVHFNSLLTTQPSTFLFPSSRLPLAAVHPVLIFLFSPACFHAFVLIPVLSFLHFLSPITLSPHSGYLSVSPFFLSAPGFFPFTFALGSGYLALDPHF